MNLAGNQESINKNIYGIMHQKNIYICEIALQRIAENNEVPWSKKPPALYYSIDFPTTYMYNDETSTAP